MRVFIGFFVPENVKNYVVGLQSDLEKLPMSCKSIAKHNLHATLSFLGNMSETEVEEIKSVLQKACKDISKFEVSLGNIKIIPNEKYIRVVVLEILCPSGALGVVSSLIKEKIGGSVKPPHLTLCRVKSVSYKESVLAGIKRIVLKDDLKFDVSVINLIKSEFSSSGLKYTVIHEAKLF